MTPAQIEAVAVADAHTTNAALPSYTALLNFAQRLAYRHPNDLLLLEDFSNIARNIVQPNAVRIV